MRRTRTTNAMRPHPSRSTVALRVALAVAGAIPGLSGCATPAADRTPEAAVSAAGASQGSAGAEKKPELWTAGILDVESQDGKPVAVTTNLGSATVPIEPGSWGLLENGRHAIGWVKVVEVSPNRSRAQIQGTLSEPIAAHTRVVVRVGSGAVHDPGPANGDQAERTPHEGDVASSAPPQARAGR